MKTLIHCFAICMIFWNKTVIAQTDARAEKLKVELAKMHTPDKKKFKLLDDLIWHYRNKDFAQANQYAKEALALAQSIDYKKGLSIAYIRLGLIYHNQNKYDSSLYYCQKSLEIEQKMNDPYGIARAKNEIGIVYMLSDKYIKAIKYFKESIQVLQNDGQHDKIGSKKANLAVCYKSLGDFQQAIKYYQEAIETYLKYKKTGQLGEAYLGLGVLYQRTNHFNTSFEFLQKALKEFQARNNLLFQAKTYHQFGFLYLSIKDYKKSIYNYQKSLSIKRKLGTGQKIQITYNNLGHVYLKINLLEKAKTLLDASLNISLKRRDTTTLGLIYNNLGEIEYKKKRYQQAIQYYNKSICYSSKVSDKFNRKIVLANLSIVYAGLENYKKAFSYYRQYNQAKDSLETSFRQAMDLKDAYQKQKQQNEIVKKNQTIQEKELARLKEYSRRQEIFNYFLGVSLFFALVAALAVIRNFQARQKIRQRQNKIDELLDEQEFIALSKMLEGQEQERDRIAQDLHDRLGGMLAMVQSHFNALENVPEVAQVQGIPQYQNATELLDEACEEVRKVAHDISSSVLQDFGLLLALADLKENIELINSLKIDLIDNGFDNQRLPAHYETQVYRIVQEMVSNVLKHAQAQKLEIQLFWIENNLHISAEDNGIGFDVQKREEKTGMGLRGMEARAKKMGGECKIDSSEGKGTIIMIDLPIE